MIQDIAKISGLYAGDELAWLAKNNPAALKSINAMGDCADRAALADDQQALKQSLSRWVNTWLFWIGNIKHIRRGNAISTPERSGRTGTQE